MGIGPREVRREVLPQTLLSPQRPIATVRSLCQAAEELAVGGTDSGGLLRRNALRQAARIARTPAEWTRVVGHLSSMSPVDEQLTRTVAHRVVEAYTAGAPARYLCLVANSLGRARVWD